MRLIHVHTYIIWAETRWQVVRGHFGGGVPYRAGNCKFDVAWLHWAMAER